MTRMYKFCWAMWIGGTILIIASWSDVVTPAIGWFGFGLALAGTLLSFGSRQPLPPLSPEQSQSNLSEMGRWNMAGSWSGEYEYDPTEEIPQGMPKISFTLDIEEEFAGKFRGRIQDDPQKGPPEPGLVKGEVVGKSMEFVKQMPVCYFFTPSGLKRFDEYSREMWGMKVDFSVPAVPIHYQGNFTETGAEITGTWWIGGELAFMSGGKRYAIVIPATTGTWHARRNPVCG